MNAQNLVRAVLQRDTVAPPAAGATRSRRRRLGGPVQMLALAHDIRRLKADLLSRGGATINTPEPPDGAPCTFPLAARTVVQPDGDMLLFVTDAYLVDVEMRQLHATRLADWFDGLERAVTATSTALRRAAFTLIAMVAVGTGQGFRTGPGFGIAALVIGSVVGLLFHAGLRLAAGHGLRQAGP